MTPKNKIACVEDKDGTNSKKKCQEGISPLDFIAHDYRLGMIKDTAKLVP